MTPGRIHIAAAILVVAAPAVGADGPVDIGSRRELFVDTHLIERLDGSAERRLHHPRPRGVVFVTDRPWEGNTSAYFTIFRDGQLCRMYYRGSHFDPKTRKATHREVTCYAESRDGIRWRRPELGLVEFAGSRKNNIVWDGVGTHDFVPFKDLSPNCPAEARYKALGRGRPKAKRGRPTPRGARSTRAIHFSPMADRPVITRGAFDSQNLAFWDTVRGEYRAYFRDFRAGRRDIRTATSKDFLHWSEPVWLEYPGAPREHLYTNQIAPYARAPHVFLGFPARYLPHRGSMVEGRAPHRSPISQMNPSSSRSVPA